MSARNGYVVQMIELNPRQHHIALALAVSPENKESSGRSGTLCNTFVGLKRTNTLPSVRDHAPYMPCILAIPAFKLMQVQAFDMCKLEQNIT